MIFFLKEATTWSRLNSVLCNLSLVLTLEVNNMNRNIEADIKSTLVNTIRDCYHPASIDKTFVASVKETWLLVM